MLAIVFCFAPALQAGTPTATQFTYQGFLENGGNPANGLFDFEFTLWNAEVSGSQVGSAVFLQDVPVEDGVFQVELDFGAAAFDGSLRWLRIRVALANGGLTTLNPRQRVTAAPMALYSLQAPGGGGEGGTLDSAYDFGGPGAGRQITADAGAVHVVGPDGMISDAGFLGPGSLIGRPEGFFDIQARHSFNIITGDPPDPATVGSYILDGTPLNPIPQWVNLMASPGGNSIRRNTGSGLLFVTEPAPLSPPDDFQMILTGGGDLGLGTLTPASRLHIADGSDATLGGGGYFVTGPSNSTNLIMDDNELMARNNGAVSRLALNNDGGDVTVAANGAGNLGIRTPAPEAPLHIMGQPDVSLGGGGGLVIGNTAGGNIGMDGNEIMARNNGTAATLFLNNDGGSVVAGSNLVVNGTLDIGYEIVSAQAGDGDSIATVSCPAGKKVIAGGCKGSFLGRDVSHFGPTSGGGGWECTWASDDENIGEAIAVCARVQ